MKLAAVQVADDKLGTARGAAGRVGRSLPDSDSRDRLTRRYRPMHALSGLAVWWSASGPAAVDHVSSDNRSLGITERGMPVTGR